MTTRGGAMGVSSFPSPPSCFRKNGGAASSPTLQLQMASKLVTSRRRITCSAVQESSTSTVDADAKEAKPVEKKAPAKPKKAPAKPLSQMMEEDVIPSLKAILEAQDDITQLELSFKENRLEGSFYGRALLIRFGPSSLMDSQVQKGFLCHPMVQESAQLSLF
ncbi:Duf2996 family protein [Salix suchowensis]|nr:Duf2996 family protein [Salix suchowensis]